MSRFTHEKPKITEDVERIYKDQEERLDHLKAGKARLLEELSKIESAMADPVQERRESLYTASHISVLPNETLSTLFHEFQSATRATGKPMLPQAEIILSHVCSHWRALVLSLPTMWCVFHRDGKVQDGMRLGLDSKTEARLAAYLDRSGQHPFDFWVEFAFTGPKSQQPLSAPLLTIIRPHLHRFRVFHLLSGAQQLPEEFREMLAMASVPLLEVCAICPDLQISDAECLNSSGTEVDVFQGGAPSLKYLLLDETSLFVIRPPLFQTVVDLRIERRQVASPAYIPNTVLAELFALPNLQTLSLFCDLFDIQVAGGGAVPGKPILARNLKHIRTAGTDLTVYLYSHVLAPSLESIALGRLTGNSGGEIGEMFPHVLERIPNHTAFPSLRIVALTGAWIGYENDLQALQIIMSATPNVEELIFWRGPAYTKPNGIFRTLLGANNWGPSFWAKIKKATLSMPFSDPTEIGYYHQFIQAKPDLEVLRVPPGCLQLTAFTEGVPSHIHVQAIEESERPVPLCWVPGPEGMDTGEEDPFVRDCRIFS